MQRTLRQAELYGYLVTRSDRLYHPGGNHALCNLSTGREMVRSGWLVSHDNRYEITPEGRRAVAAVERA